MRGNVAAAAALLLAAGFASAAGSSYSAKQVAVTVDGKAAAITSVNGLSYDSTKASPVTLRVDANIDASLFSWLQGSMSAAKPTRTLAIAHGTKTATFDSALITEVSFPKFDASSKEPAYLQLTIQPERVKLSAAKAATVGKVKQKKWLASNFTFELGSLPAGRASKIDAITFKQGAVKDQVGKVKEPTKHPAKLEVPNLKVTFSAAGAQLKKWRDAKSSLSAKLTLTDSAGKPWARVVMSQVKVLILAPGGRDQEATLSVGSAKLTR